MSFLLSHVSGVFLSAAAVLNVMKTVGLVVLILVIIMAAFAACVMFIPARYQAKGDIEQMEFDVKLHWFLKIIMFRASYKNSMADYALYIFGIRTKVLDKDVMEKRKRKREKRKAKKAARKHKSRKKKYQKEHNKYKEQFLKENQLDDETLRQATGTRRMDTRDKLEADATRESSQQKAQGNASVTPANAMAVVKKVVHILKTVQEHRPVQMLWADIQKLAHRARPRKVKADIVFGFDDPALTGQVLGTISNLYFIYQYDQLCINGDFETEASYIRGDFDIKGHIRAVFALIFVIRVIRKKQFRKFMKALKL
ncbi:MAG: hypothetical protein IJ471_07260 [Eubacterium sp.]|nr:hypothetical protein [Eubacterium sp.]